jgi:hypothetical protein
MEVEHQLASCGNSECSVYQTCNVHTVSVEENMAPKAAIVNEVSTN